VNAALKVLVFSYSHPSADDLVAGLRDGGFAVDWKRVETREDLGLLLNGEPWDLILSDDTLVTFDAAMALGVLVDAGREIPFIVISSTIGKFRAVDLMKAGAADIISPGETGRLLATVERALRAGRIRRQQRHDEDRIRRQANYDPLTDLPNRALFFDRLSQALKRATREDSHLALQYLDLDRFKWINDGMGHATGDALLKEAARRLVTCVRDSDTVARIGGDEFAIILSNAEGQNSSSIVAAKIIEAFADPYQLGKQEVTVSVSIGSALFPSDGLDADTLLTNADAAMYQAKKQGRNRACEFHPRMQKQASSSSQTLFPLLAWRRQLQGTVSRFKTAAAYRGTAVALVGIATAGWLIAAFLAFSPPQGDAPQIARDLNPAALDYSTASGPAEKPSQ